MRTVEDFEKQVAAKDIRKWSFRKCSMCRYPLGYVFAGCQVGFDSGCYCTGTQTILPASMEDVADMYNMQDNPELIAEMDKFWGFV